MFVVLLLSACWCASALSASVPNYKLEEAASHFEDFINKYNKQYAHEKEKETRFHIFLENLKDVNQKNNASKHTEYGITQFMDLTLEEFKAMYTGFKAPEGVYNNKCQKRGDNDVSDHAPESFDWRDYQVVSPVKFQEWCFSSYAFSCTGHIESQYAIKHGKILSLSEQQILDCDKGSHGCAGGTTSSAYSSLIKMGGIELESAYPYIASTLECIFDKNQVAVVVTNCYQYNLSNQEKVKQLLHKVGPISIAVYATIINTYTGGIILHDQCQGDNGFYNFALLVGYGTSEDGIPYWLVKSSWGESWGEQGYFKMERTDDGNSCGMKNDFMMSVDIQ